MSRITSASSRDPSGTPSILQNQNTTTPGDVEVQQQTSSDWRSDPSSTIKEKLYNSLLTGCFSDIRFIVGTAQKKEIPAHRFILFLNSPVFETLLDGSHKAVNVTISDVEPEAFFSFLKFLYTDEFDVHVKDATAVLYLSKKYAVSRLSALAAEHIKANISTKNVVNVLLSAELLGESSIAFQARYFLRKNIRYVIHEDNFLQLSEEELAQIFSSDELSVSEMELFNAAVHWAIEECKRQNLEANPQNYRFVLKNIIPLIRFPLMDRKEFTLHVATKHVLTDTECLNIIMHFDVTPKERACLPPLMFINKPRIETNFTSSDGITSYLPSQESMMMPPQSREMDKTYYYDQMGISRGGYNRSTPVQQFNNNKPPPPPRSDRRGQIVLTPTNRRHQHQQRGTLQPFSYLPDPYTGTVSFPQNYSEY